MVDVDAGRRRLVRTALAAAVVAVLSVPVTTQLGYGPAAAAEVAILTGAATISWGWLLSWWRIAPTSAALAELALAVALTATAVAVPPQVTAADLAEPHAVIGRWVLYLLLAAALVLATHARTLDGGPALWLDGAVVGAAAAALLAQFWYVPFATDPAVPEIVRGLYAIGDLVLVAVVVATLLQPRATSDWVGRLLLTGVGISLVCDVVQVSLLARGDTPAAWLGLLSSVGMLIVASAGWAPRAAQGPVRTARGPEVSVPAASVLAAGALLVAAATRHLPLAVVVLATASLAAFSGRTALTFRDIALLAQTRREAVTDDLTGLANRRQLMRHLQALTHHVGTGARGALLLIDLNQFKEINDALGHPVGDLLLQQLGPRLSTGLRTGDQLARLGGDEFGVLLAGADAEGATAAAGRLTDALTEPFVVAGVTLYVQASIGVALYPQHGPTGADLLRHADVAMYLAKRRHVPHVVYSSDDDPQYRDSLQVVAELRVALESNQLLCHYQPKCDLRTGRVVGVEALLRWQHPERGLLAPGAFLSVAEQAGLMDQLFTVVLESALRQCRTWRQDGVQLGVSVNAAASNLLDASLPAQVVAALQRHELPPESLTVEITENEMMTDPKRARETVTALRAAGVQVSVDDYGTGYSALSYLSSLALTELKIDRLFVQRMATNERDAQIVRSTIDLAHALGLTVVAEGAESEQEWQTLARIGCDLGQGYFVSRPLPPDEVPGQLESWRAKARAAAGTGGSRAA